MEKLPSTEKLKEVLAIAERTLEELKDDDSNKAKRKIKRINKALEKAYETLNKTSYTKSELDKRTDEVWISLMDDDNYFALLIFFFGFSLAGVVIFAVFQAYSFIQDNWDSDPSDNRYTITENNLSELISVNYKEKNIISLYDQMTVSDEKGLQNPPQEFTISNDSTKVKGLNYIVNYSVEIIPMNDPNAKILNKRYIKYKYTYKNSWNGKTYESKVGTLDELPVNADGSITMTTGSQMKDSKTDFKVVFWLSAEAGDEEQGRTYTMAFKVNAAIANS